MSILDKILHICRNFKGLTPNRYSEYINLMNNVKKIGVFLALISHYSKRNHHWKYSIFKKKTNFIFSWSDNVFKSVVVHLYQWRLILNHVHSLFNIYRSIFLPDTLNTKMGEFCCHCLRVDYLCTDSKLTSIWDLRILHFFGT